MEPGNGDIKVGLECVSYNHIKVDVVFIRFLFIGVFI